MDISNDSIKQAAVKRMKLHHDGFVGWRSAKIRGAKFRESCMSQKPNPEAFCRSDR